MAEEEVPAASERVLKIQRVFINQLDTYSSGNIGKVSGGPRVSLALSCRCVPLVHPHSKDLHHRLWLGRSLPRRRFQS